MPQAKLANNARKQEDPSLEAHRAVTLLRDWMIVALLALPASACDSVSRYLAGMDDPTNFTWQKSDTAARVEPPPAQAPTRETRQRILGLGDDTLVVPEAPQPVKPPPQPKSLAQDLKDCEAPNLEARTPATGAPAVPTIERSEHSPVVAECMADKGYRKVYQPRSEMF
jgi:hypothetical protein